MRKKDNDIVITLLESDTKNEIKDDLDKIQEILLRFKRVKINPSLSAIPENTAYQIDADNYYDLFMSVVNLKIILE